MVTNGTVDHGGRNQLVTVGFDSGSIAIGFGTSNRHLMHQLFVELAQFRRRIRGSFHQCAFGEPLRGP